MNSRDAAAKAIAQAINQKSTSGYDSKMEPRMQEIQQSRINAANTMSKFAPAIDVNKNSRGE